MDPDEIQELFETIQLQEADMSFEDIRRFIMRELESRITDRWVSIHATYDDSVVYCLEPNGDDYIGPVGMFRRTYTLGDDNSITFGDPEPVVEQTTYEPAPISEAVVTGNLLTDGALIEAVSDSDGWQWRIQIIESGISANRTEYPLELLHRRVGLYEDVEVFAARGPDHNPGERGFEAVAGWIRDPIGNSTGIEGVFEIRRGRDDIRETFLQAWERVKEGHRWPFGFSHVVPAGHYKTQAVRLAEGLVSRVLDYDLVGSVDIVLRPSAGGQPIGLVAAVDNGETERELAVLEQLLERLANGENLTEAELRQVMTEAESGEYEYAMARRQMLATAVVESTDDDTTEDTDTPQDTESTDDDSDDGEDTEITEARRDARAMRDELREVRLERAMLVLESELSESGLPDPLVANIRQDFRDRTEAFDRSEVAGRIDRERDTYARLMDDVGGRVPRSRNVEVTGDERDRLQESMDGMFGLVRGDSADGSEDTLMQWHRTPMHFRSINHAYQEITGQQPRPNRVLGEAAQYIGSAIREDDPELVESITTSTFAEVLGSSMHRRMIAQYNQPSLQSYNQLFSEVSSLADFRTNHRVRLGGYGDLPDVGEGAVYQPLTTPGDEEATYSPSKKGGTEDFTMEALANDDMSVIRAVPVGLGNAAVRTIRHYVFNTILRDNITIYDTVALFHTVSHGNLGSSAFSSASLSTTRLAMRSQFPYGISTQPLGVANIPRTIWVPNELEELAFQVATSNVEVNATPTATTPNLHRGVRVEIVDEWTDGTDWVATADPSNMPLLEVGYLNGRAEPELFVQDQANVGSVFNADKVTWKIRHIWGIVVLDYRGFYKHVS